MSKSASFLALSCVGFIATAPAHAADEPKTDVERDSDQEILVNGQRVKHAANPKMVAPLVNTPRSIVVLPKEIIEQTGSNSLADALRTVPGITFGAAEGGNPIGDRPFIRGFETQGSIYVDNVRDLGAQSREVFAVETIQIVRGSDSTLGGRGSAGGSINILSKLPQPDNFGAVNASYGNADYKRITADLNLKVGDTAAFRINGLWHDQDIAGRDSIYQRRWGVAPSFTIGMGTPTRLTASYYYLESHELPDSGIPYLYTIGNAPGTGRIDSRPALGRVTTAGGQTGSVDRSTFYGLVDRDFRDATTNQATFRVEHDFGGVTLRNTARYTHSDQSYIYTQPDDSQGNVYGTTALNMGPNLTNGGYVWRRANTRYGYSESIINQTDLYGEIDTGGIKHNFALGTEFSNEKTRRGTFVVASGAGSVPRCTADSVARYNCTSLFAPNPNDPWVNYATDASNVRTPVTRGALNTETQNDADTKAVYAFDSITLMPALILNIGARYDRFKSTVTLPVAAGSAAARLSHTDDLFNWQAGLVFKPTPTTSVYGSYATAATPPNSLLGEGREENALPTAITAVNLTILDALKPQKTKSYEIGAKASLFGDRLNLGLAGFQTDIANARVTTDQNTVAFLGKTRIRGIEFSANGTILPGWTVFGGYTYLDPKIIDGGFSVLTAPAIMGRAAQAVSVPSVNTGKQVPQTARHSFTATTNVDVTRRFQIGGTAIYIDEQFGGYADNRAALQNAAGVVTIIPATKILYRGAPSYWRFDARASYQLTDAVQVSVNAQNLSDEAYFNTVYASHYAGIAPGRTVFGTIGLKF